MRVYRGNLGTDIQVRVYRGTEVTDIQGVCIGTLKVRIYRVRVYRGTEGTDIQGVCIRGTEGTNLNRH